VLDVANFNLSSADFFSAFLSATAALPLAMFLSFNSFIAFAFA
jgi:hypothetical protein